MTVHTYDTMCLGCSELKTSLAAAQAENRALREALTDVAAKLGATYGKSCNRKQPCGHAVCDSQMQLAAALATKPDDEGLRVLMRTFGRNLVQKLFGFESTESLDIVDRQLDAELRGGQ